MDLEECEKKGIIRKIKIDTNLVRSICEMSNIKENAVKQTKLNNENINAFLPMAYDALREVLEALCILKGYKVINHVCLGILVKKLDPEFDLFLFDRFRYVRNGINYYGNKIEIEEGKRMIEGIFSMRKAVLNKIKLNLKK